MAITQENIRRELARLGENWLNYRATDILNDGLEVILPSQADFFSAKYDGHYIHYPFKREALQDCSLKDFSERYLNEAAKMLFLKRDRPELPYQPGDIVFLKSGSPPLTVERRRDDGLVDVHWFAGEEHRSDAFPSALLAYKYGTGRMPFRVSRPIEGGWMGI